MQLVAKRNAQEAISLAKQRALHFDTQTALQRKANEAKDRARVKNDVEAQPEATPDFDRE
jgi:DNA helicase INO80